MTDKFVNPVHQLHLNLHPHLNLPQSPLVRSATTEPQESESKAIYPPDSWVLEKEWVKDKGINTCQRHDCNNKFGRGYKDKHHCRRCGGIYCDDCTSERWPSAERVGTTEKGKGKKAFKGRKNSTLLCIECLEVEVNIEEKGGNDICTKRYPGGQYYEGEYRILDTGERSPQGHGKIAEGKGKTYEGDWSNGTFHGQGTRTATDGSIYEGTWDDGVREGKGLKTWAGGESYDGNWENDKMHGQGTWRDIDGSNYVGRMKDNLPNGPGTMTISEGEGNDPNTYKGAWVKGAEEGKGLKTWADGRTYDGYWKNGKMHGQGTWTGIDGSNYVGRMVDDEMDGEGKYTFLDGRTYEGNWENGKMHGWGKYTFLDGKIYEGNYTHQKWQDIHTKAGVSQVDSHGGGRRKYSRRIRHVKKRSKSKQSKSKRSKSKRKRSKRRKTKHK